jgi:hypothetical protein
VLLGGGISQFCVQTLTQCPACLYHHLCPKPRDSLLQHFPSHFLPGMDWEGAGACWCRLLSVLHVSPYQPYSPSVQGSLPGPLHPLSAFRPLLLPPVKSVFASLLFSTLYSLADWLRSLLVLPPFSCTSSRWVL